MDEATYESLKGAGFAPRQATAVTSNAHETVKTVADPSAAYASLVGVWRKSRAVCRGEQFVKDYDSHLDTVGFTNLLIPFSPSMRQDQYAFYKAEAELPGITSQFAKTLVGGLLRKQPTIKFPDSMPQEQQEDAARWIIHEFGKDDSALSAFLDDALWEEVQTSAPWLFVDYPKVGEDEEYEEGEEPRPYPVLVAGESVINTRTRTDAKGRTVLDRVIVKGHTEVYDNDKHEFHPKYVPTVWVHELDQRGKYRVRIFKVDDSTDSVEIVGGQKQVKFGGEPVFQLVDTVPVKIRDEEIDIIPAWPLNGSIDRDEPMLMAIVNKEIALYNKISRRNHLMYGAATYTPVISSNMSDDKFDEVVEGGLGTWLHLEQGDTADVLKTPTEALKDMELAIAAGYEEIAKLGVRMLAPETGDQSGVALELRNATQTAQLGALNTKVSNTMRAVICFMVNWHYDLELKPSEIDFELSSDFNPVPQGADWLRLATEWYQNGLIPRTAWLLILKQNDMLAPDYNDEEGQKEINADETVVGLREQNDQQQDNFATQMKSKLQGGDKSKDKKPPPK